MMNHITKQMGIPNDSIWLNFALADYEPFESFRDCEKCPEMVMVPAGEFMMGDPNGEGSIEGPYHKVTIPNPFAIGKYEVTGKQFFEYCDFSSECYRDITKNSQWLFENLKEDVEKLRNNNKRNGKRFYIGPGKIKTDEQTDSDLSLIYTAPLDIDQDYSWIYTPHQFYPAWRQVPEQAENFCRALSKATSLNYRLPTEAEWEYAARAGTNTAYSTGENIKPDEARFTKNREMWPGIYTLRIPSSERDKYLELPYESSDMVHVGLFPPNAWGLHDMHGNVSELVADTVGYVDANGELQFDYAMAPNNGEAQHGPTRWRVYRGGNWGSDASLLRSYTRHIEGPLYPFDPPKLEPHKTGFRCVRNFNSGLILN